MIRDCGGGCQLRPQAASHKTELRAINGFHTPRLKRGVIDLARFGLLLP